MKLELNLSSPPPIGDLTPNTGNFSLVSRPVENNAPGGSTTYTLTAASKSIQYVSTAQAVIFKMPDATTLSNGTEYSFYWVSGSTCTIQNTAAGAVMAGAGGVGLSTIKLVDNSTANGVWSVLGSVTPNTTMLTTFGAFGSTPSTVGASISGRTMTMQPADATHPGGVSTTTQSFAGDKTFTGAVAVTGAITGLNATAIPAGGTAGSGLLVSSTANFGVFFGSGAPTLSAAKGSLYMRSDGSGVNDRMYVNTNGTTTWTSVVTVA